MPNQDNPIMLIFVPRLSVLISLKVKVCTLSSALILDHDVVLVHIHYRLSSLGFLCVNSKESHSNVGLLDQVSPKRQILILSVPLKVMALKWVQKHIRHFGGDPRRVTLVGESAGGASVAYLASSTAARGLFSRAIAMSGSSTAQWSSNSRGLERAGDLAARLGCPRGEAEAMVRCLKYERSMDQIILAQNEIRLQNFAEMKSIGSESAPCPDQNFRPARYQYDLQRWTRNSLLRSSSDIANPVPTLVTSVRDEGTLFAALAVKNFFQSPVNAKRISAPGYYYHQFLVDLLRLLQVPGWTDGKYVEFIKRSYFHSQVHSRIRLWLLLPTTVMLQELGSLEGILPGLAAILGRFMIKEPGYDFARLNSERAPTYLMSFEYQGENSFFTYLAPHNAEVQMVRIFFIHRISFQDMVSGGIAHGDDLQYLFYTGIFNLSESICNHVSSDKLNQQLFSDRADQAVASRFIRLILSFAVSGSPQPGLPPISANSSHYLLLGDTISVRRDYTTTFWRYRAP